MHTAPLSEKHTPHTPRESMRNRWPGALLLHTPPLSDLSRGQPEICFPFHRQRRATEEGVRGATASRVSRDYAMATQLPPLLGKARPSQQDAPFPPLALASPCWNLRAAPTPGLLGPAAKEFKWGFSACIVRRNPVDNHSRRQVPVRWVERNLGLVTTRSQRVTASSDEGTSGQQSFGQDKA